jgi:hypothetical protein
MLQSTRFSYKRALQEGWELEILPRSKVQSRNQNIFNLEYGPPVKVEASTYINPPRGWDSFSNVIESIFVVRRESDLPSHAVNVSPCDTSCNTTIVSPSNFKGWTTAMKPEEWEDVGYGTIYFDSPAAIPILDYTFHKHTIMSNLGVDMRRQVIRHQGHLHILMIHLLFCTVYQVVKLFILHHLVLKVFLI